MNNDERSYALALNMCTVSYDSVDHILYDLINAVP